MCDTFAAGPSWTADGTSIFGKNSDREPDETHLVVSLPSAEHPAGQQLQCTYVTIPQARATYAALVCKPFWIWGAEMGVNEKGVVIGNEALFTRVRPEKKPGLTGMDLLRLALERACDAEESATVITDLLKRYGQAGPCGYRDKKFSYMNSFLIMDRGQIIVLETLGRDYALKRLKDYAVISNSLTLGSSWERSSLPPGTDVCSKSDPLMSFFAGSSWRRDANEKGMLAFAGRFTTRHAFSLLRGHAGNEPFRGFNRDVCMHAGDPFVRKSQTTGSLVVELHPRERLKIFVTVGSAPCLTPFKPFLPAAPWEAARRGGALYTEDSAWWSHEAMYVNAMVRPHAYRTTIGDRVRALEEKWCSEYPAHAWNSQEPFLVKLTASLFEQALEADRMFMDEMKRIKPDRFSLKSLYWRHTAQRCGVPFMT